MGDLIVRQPSNISGFPLNFKCGVGFRSRVRFDVVNGPLIIQGITYHLSIHTAREQSVVVRYVDSQQRGVEHVVVFSGDMVAPV